MPISPSMTHPQNAMVFMNHDGGALDDKYPKTAPVLFILYITSNDFCHMTVS